MSLIIYIYIYIYLDSLLNSRALFYKSKNFECCPRLTIISQICKKTDIYSPIKLVYNQKFIECSLIERSSEGLDIKLAAADANSLVITFDLLNPAEYFVHQFISLNRLSDPKIEFRIDGLSRISSGRISSGSMMKDVFDGKKLRNLISGRPVHRLLVSCAIVTFAIFIVNSFDYMLRNN
jgi:hypothetical protein